MKVLFKLLILFLIQFGILGNVAASTVCTDEHPFVPRIVTKGFESYARHGVNPKTFNGIKTRIKNPKTNYEIDFKILILSAESEEKNDPGLMAAISFLQNMWIPYEVMTLTKDGTRDENKKLVLVNEDGSGKYSGIITTEFNLAYKTVVNGKTDYVSALTKAEWQSLFDYEALYRVRHVSLYTYPQAFVGVTAIPNSDNHKSTSVSFDSKYLNEYASGYHLDAIFPIKDNWHYPVTINEVNKHDTFPIAYFGNDSSQIAGIYRKLDDGREQMHFFFSQSRSHFLSKFIAPIWIKWLTRNVYTGKRRTYLTAQIDDYLIPTKLWHGSHRNSHRHKSGEYRTSTQDIQHFIDFQNYFLKGQTLDPNYKAEMAMNGKGIVLYGGAELDPLSDFSIKNSGEFNWVSHTYSHPELDDITYPEVIEELKNNVEVAKYLLKENFHLYSEFGIVTPRISGLYNPEALKALYDFNIKYVIGDNSVLNFRSPDNKHLMRATTKELNGFEGVHIVPRFPTDIFYNVSTLPELESLFNHFYHYEGAKKYDYNKIYQKNAHEVVSHLFEFDYSPYMFHQANMRIFEKDLQHESLLSLWFKSVIEEYRKYSTFPLPSLSFNELIDVYNERKNYEECKMNARFTVSEQNLSQIKFSSLIPCVVPLTGITKTASERIIQTETFGPDVTTYVKLNGRDDEVVLQINEMKY